MGIFSDVLLTVDYDRTLTATDSTIPERNLTAIRYFIENGGAFTVNTGRSLPMTRVFRDIVPVNAPLLLYNGSAAYDTTGKQLTFAHDIPMDLWETVRECRKLFPDLTVEVQGIITLTVFSQAILHKMPTSAQSLPPELPNTMPFALLFSKRERIKATRSWVSFS